MRYPKFRTPKKIAPRPVSIFSFPDSQIQIFVRVRQLVSSDEPFTPFSRRLAAHENMATCDDGALFPLVSEMKQANPKIGPNGLKKGLLRDHGFVVSSKRASRVLRDARVVARAHRKRTFSR